MPAWYEFLCGPVAAEQEEAVRAFLAEVIPFNEEQARESARLFNAAGRKRSLRVDAMIAGTAIVAGARLATGNRNDFVPFLAHGLELV
jgi:predicted nucleic acid-binding protein